MTCCGRREKPADVRAEQKWDYINLSDFKSTTCFTPLSYGILYISLIISVAVYGVDIFTAANLLFFNRWSGQVRPVIPFHISRWIFAACIVVSWILLVYRWVRAVRAIRTGIVAASYLDPLAFMIQSIRMGANGRGWKRFLVFAELTKGRKGAEYVALFTYFSFEAWLRIVFAEGPRQVINALTLYSVMQANLVPVGEHAPKEGDSPAAQFFINIRILANQNKEQAAILFGMLFTLVIWVVTALSLALAALCYILFLWHYIPTADDGLTGYCRRKVDSRLHKIVGVKVKRALAIEYSPRSGSDLKTAKAGPTSARATRQPTLPIIDFDGEDKRKEEPTSRRTTQATLPPYAPSAVVGNSGRPKHGLRAELIIPYMPPFQNRPVPSSRGIVNSAANSGTNYASNAPLLQAAGEMSHGPPPDAHSENVPPNLRPSHYSTHHPPSMERSFRTNLHGPRRSYDTTYGPPPSQCRNPPHSLLAGPPGLKNSFQSEFKDSKSQFHSATENHYLGPVPEVSPLNYSRARKPNQPHLQQGRLQEHEMQHPRPTEEVEPRRKNDAYVAFHPNIRTYLPSPAGRVIPRKPATGPTRNFTLPFSQPPRASQAAPHSTGPHRPGTAPVPFAPWTTQPTRHPTFGPRNEVPQPTPFTQPRRPAAAATAGPDPAARHGERTTPLPF